MKIHDYLGNSNYCETLTSQLKDKEGEMYLVLIEYKDNDLNNLKTDFLGLDTALSLKDKGKVIILCSFLPEHYIYLNFPEKWQALMSIPHLSFLRMPFNADDLWQAYQIAKKKIGLADSLSLSLYQEKKQREEIGCIQHKYKQRLMQNDPEAIAGAIKEARECQIDGSDEDIIAKIKSFKRESNYSAFKGKELKGVFCDIDGTLIKDGVLQEKVYKMLKKLSKDNKIYLWTGGNLEDTRKALLKLKISWDLFSKNQFNGAHVEMAVDNEDIEVLEQEYNVQVDTFVKV